MSFEVDDFLPTNPDLPTYGLNIAFAWPLPENLRKAYEKLYKELSYFGDNVYVYPYEKTHTTVMTLVNFKNHQNPSNEEIQKIKKIIPAIISIVSEVLLRERIKPFKINIGSPILSKRAAYLPISNPTGEIFLLRKKVAQILEKKLSLKVEYNKDFIHSTIMRFYKIPSDTKKFINKFESIAKDNQIGSATINELLLTSETMPYMRNGEKIHVFSL
ncbi:MAG TPA: hypothetical protein P5232_02905 [Candidatus Moranbacteria bacterium]|nr:hypothetical protein [Candidatus Moranbacteria bacterium]